MKKIRVVENTDPLTLEDPAFGRITLIPLPEFDGYCRIKYLDENSKEIIPDADKNLLC